MDRARIPAHHRRPAFLPHARDLLRAADRAAASVRPGRRALRVDVLGRRLAPAVLLRDFNRAHPGIDLDVVTLYDAAALRGHLASRRRDSRGTWAPAWAADRRRAASA